MDKIRKEYEGPLRNKERTKLKILNAVGEILKRDGYTGLRINKIVALAKVDRKTLYEYFGNVDNLIETYIRNKDYYMAYHDQAEALAKEYTSKKANELTQKLLLKQLETFSLDEEMQKILLWHMSEINPLLYEINEERERIGSIFMNLCTPQFEDTPVHIRGRIALIIGGIYFLVLYSKNTKGEFCQLDLNTEQGMESIRISIAQMIDEAFKLSKNKP
jgi:AcrR family transcriptional regulator